MAEFCTTLRFKDRGKHQRLIIYYTYSSTSPQLNPTAFRFRSVKPSFIWWLGVFLRCNTWLQLKSGQSIYLNSVIWCFQVEEKCTHRAEPSPGETNMVTAAAAVLNIAPAGTSAMPPPCTNHIILHLEHGEVIYTSQTAPHPPLGRITHANVPCFDTRCDTDNFEQK